MARMIFKYFFSELETQIELLRDTQRKYCNILRLSRALTSHFYHVVQTQHALGEAFSDLAQKSPELQEEFLYNSETQRNLTKNGETLLGALNFFVSSVNTLCNKTIEDTLLTVRQYETARYAIFFIYLLNFYHISTIFLPSALGSFPLPLPLRVLYLFPPITLPLLFLLIIIINKYPFRNPRLLPRATNLTFAKIDFSLL